MGKCGAAAIAILAISTLLVGAAQADDALKEGRSASTCSNDVLVCAFMKDGSSRPTSECGARRDGAIRVLPGDCFDPD